MEDMMSNRSDSIAQLSEALSKAQAAFVPPAKDGKVDTGKYRYAYLTLPAVWESVRKPLTENGLAVTQQYYDADGAIYMETVLMHTSGEWISSTLPVCAIGTPPQQMGSASTYARRYSLSALIGVVWDEDDDAEKAQASRPAQQQRPQPQRQRKAQAPAPASNGTWSKEKQDKAILWAMREHPDAWTVSKDRASGEYVVERRHVENALAALLKANPKASNEDWMKDVQDREVRRKRERNAELDTQAQQEEARF